MISVILTIGRLPVSRVGSLRYGTGNGTNGANEMRRVVMWDASRVAPVGSEARATVCSLCERDLADLGGAVISRLRNAQCATPFAPRRSGIFFCVFHAVAGVPGRRAGGRREGAGRTGRVTSTLT